MVRRMGIDGRIKRLEKRYGGTIVGEMAFFQKKTRHISLVAGEDDTGTHGARPFPGSQCSHVLMSLLLRCQRLLSSHAIIGMN